MKKTDSRNKTDRLLRPLFIIILFAFVITSGLLGFVMGKNATGELRGTQLDTIPLMAPTSLSASDVGDEITHFLSARVRSASGEYLKSVGEAIGADGTPLPNIVLKLGSKAEEKSDSEGVFRFSDIQSGAYTLKAVDTSKRVIATTEVTFDFNRSRELIADLSAEDKPRLVLPDNTRMLELTVKLEGEKILISEDDSYVTTTDYDLITFKSKALSMDSAGMTVTPSGNLIVPEGYVIFPESMDVITPEGYIERQSHERVVAPGIQITQDGRIETDSGVQINPDSSVEAGDEVYYPSEQPIVIKDDEVGKVDIEDDYTPVPAPPVEPAPPPISSMPEEPSPGDEGDDGGKDDAPPSLPESQADEPTPSPTPPSTFIAESVDGVSWQQQSAVDLFSKRIDSSGKVISKSINTRKAEAQTPIIEPGAKGYYLFRLINDNDFAIEYQMKLTEQTFHLPLLYSLYSESGRINYMSANEISGDGTLMADAVRIPGKSEVVYRLDWEWPYQTSDKKRRSALDAQDTEVAVDDDRAYMIAIDISATRKDIVNPDDETRYPGLRE